MLQACDVAIVDEACLVSGRWKGICPNARLAATPADDREMSVRGRDESSWVARLVNGPVDPYAAAAAAAHAIMGRNGVVEFSLAGRPAKVVLHRN